MILPPDRPIIPLYPIPLIQVLPKGKTRRHLPNPSSSQAAPAQTRNSSEELLSDGFPPIKIFKAWSHSPAPSSTPAQYQTKVKEEPQSPQTRLWPYTKTGLGDKNILNSLAIDLKDARNVKRLRSHEFKPSKVIDLTTSSTDGDGRDAKPQARVAHRSRLPKPPSKHNHLPTDSVVKPKPPYKHNRLGDINHSEDLERPSKRKRLTFIEDDDMSWLKGEIDSMRGNVSRIQAEINSLEKSIRNLVPGCCQSDSEE